MNAVPLGAFIRRKLWQLSAGSLLAVGVIVSLRHGWAETVRTHPAGQVPAGGTTYHQCSGQIGTSGYFGRGLDVTLDRTGIYVTSNFWFDRDLAPCRLAWSDVVGVTIHREHEDTPVLLQLADAKGRVSAPWLPEAAVAEARRLAAEQGSPAISRR